MAAPVTYQRITLYFEHPWNYAGESVHRWSVKFNLSGATALTAPQMEPTALDLAAPILGLSRSSGHLVGWRYYPPEGHTATGLKDYLAGEHPCTRSFYTGGTGVEQQLEVSALAECPIGKSSTGKPVFLRKWIHGVLADPPESNDFHAPNNPPSGGALGKWNTGSGPNLVVPVDPTGGTQGGPWTLTSHLHTHQLRRGPKRKKAATVFVPVPLP